MIAFRLMIQPSVNLTQFEFMFQNKTIEFVSFHDSIE